MLKVVIKKERYLDEISRQNGYLMVGCEGKFISARTPENKFIWVRLNPPKITKVFNAYDTLQEALEAKVEGGYEVLEIDEDDIEINYNF